MPMMVAITENASAALRGRLALWLVEVRAGVYIGSYGERVREMLWKTIESGIGDGNAVLAWAAPTEAGYEFRFHGFNRRRPVDLDGLKLVSYVDDSAEANVLLDLIGHQNDQNI